MADYPQPESLPASSDYVVPNNPDLNPVMPIRIHTGDYCAMERHGQEVTVLSSNKRDLLATVITADNTSLTSQLLPLGYTNLGFVGGQQAVVEEHFSDTQSPLHFKKAMDEWAKINQANSTKVMKALPVHCMDAQGASTMPVLSPTDVRQLAVKAGGYEKNAGQPF